MAGKILIQGSVVRALYGILALFMPKRLLASVGMSEEIRVRGKLGRTTIIGAAFNVLGYFTWLRALSALSSPSASSE